MADESDNGDMAAQIAEMREELRHHAEMKAELAEMRDAMWKLSTPESGGTVKSTVKIDVPILDKNAVNEMGLFNLWTREASMYTKLTQMAPADIVQLLSLSATSKLSSDVRMAAALDNVPSADLSDTEMVSVAEALSKHDLHVIADVPACLVSYFGVVKTALGHDQAAHVVAGIEEFFRLKRKTRQPVIQFEREWSRSLTHLQQRGSSIDPHTLADLYLSALRLKDTDQTIARSTLAQAASIKTGRIETAAELAGWTLKLRSMLATVHHGDDASSVLLASHDAPVDQDYCVDEDVIRPVDTGDGPYLCFAAREFTGRCNRCWGWGHKAADCTGQLKEGFPPRQPFHRRPYQNRRNVDYPRPAVEAIAPLPAAPQQATFKTLVASIQSLTEALAPVTLTDDEAGAILDGAGTSVSPVLVAMDLDCRSGEAIIDPGATRNLCGRRARMAAESIHGAGFKQVAAHATFQFGDGKRTQSTSARVWPLLVAGAKHNTLVFEVDGDDQADLPLLLSRSTLSDVNAQVHYSGEGPARIEVAGRRWESRLSQHGHDVVRVLGGENRDGNTDHQAFINKKITSYPSLSGKLRVALRHDPVKVADHLHRTAGHPNSADMVKLARALRLPRDLVEVFRDTPHRCSGCVQVMPRPPKPLVALRADVMRPFDLCTVDVATVLGDEYLKFVDVFSRYAVYVQLSDMSAQTVVRAVSHVADILGVPTDLLADRGSNFLNEALWAWCDAAGTNLRFVPTLHWRGMAGNDQHGGMAKAMARRLAVQEEIDSVVKGVHRMPGESMSKEDRAQLVGSAVRLVNNSACTGGFTPQQVALSRGSSHLADDIDVPGLLQYLHDIELLGDAGAAGRYLGVYQRCTVAHAAARLRMVAGKLLAVKKRTSPPVLECGQWVWIFQEGKSKQIKGFVRARVTAVDGDSVFVTHAGRAKCVHLRDTRPYLTGDLWVKEHGIIRQGVESTERRPRPVRMSIVQPPDLGPPEPTPEMEELKNVKFNNSPGGTPPLIQAGVNDGTRASVTATLPDAGTTQTLSTPAGLLDTDADDHVTPISAGDDNDTVDDGLEQPESDDGHDASVDTIDSADRPSSPGHDDETDKEDAEGEANTRDTQPPAPTSQYWLGDSVTQGKMRALDATDTVRTRSTAGGDSAARRFHGDYAFLTPGQIKRMPVQPEHDHLFQKDLQGEIQAYKDNCDLISEEEAVARGMQIWDIIVRKNWKPTGLTTTDLEDGIDPGKATHLIRTDSSKPAQLVRAKARCCVGGHRDKAIRQYPIDVAHAKPDSINLIASTTARTPGHGLIIGDMHKAYFQALKTRGDVALRPLPEAGLPPGWLWLPRSQVYGDPEAGAGFLVQVYDHAINECGFRRCTEDPNVFILEIDGVYHGSMALSMDDIFAGGDEKMEQALDKLDERFPLGDRSVGGGVYCGVRWSTAEDGTITADLNEYVSAIDEIRISDDKMKDGERRLDVEDNLRLRTLVGTLHFVTTRTRPQDSCAISFLQSQLHKSRIRHVKTANKILRRMRETPHEKLTFATLSAEAIPIVISDCALQNRPDGRTQGGWMTGLYARSTGQFHLIGWKSKALTRCVHDSTQAETRQAQLSVQAGESFSMKLAEFEGKDAAPFALYSDCLDLISKTFSLKAGFKDPRLNHIVEEIRQLLRNGTCEHMGFVSGEHNPADCLTKPANRTRRVFVNALQGKLSLPSATGRGQDVRSI